jgi:hypothetical protein
MLIVKYKFLLNIFFTCIFIQAQTNTINLVSDNKSSYKIILSDSASHWDSLAANELLHYIKEISGVQLPIISDSSTITNEEIIIGINNHSTELDLSSIHGDGFIIKTAGDKIYFAGAEGKGTLNAVHTFLEKYLNCRTYSSKVKIIPELKSIRLPQINEIENPVIDYRATHYYEAMNDEYCRWHKLVDSDDKKTWGLFVHTFRTLIPAEKYFQEHPEYFALRDSLRVPEQPCLSSQEVFKIMVEELRKRIKENPGAKIWSVSQNDNYSNCQCPLCSKIDLAEDSPSGSLINFVNKVALEFPDKIISTLAYQYSRKPPKTIKPEKNVNIMLCSIESYRTKPLEEDISADSFIRDLAGWSKISKNIIVWDYVVQFTSLVSPFPNFHVLQPNIQTFHKYGVKMIFEQGAGNRQGSEFNELRTYLIAKLLWNPFISIDSVMNDFLNGYYGEAGKQIRAYIALMTSELIKSNAKLWIYDSPVASMKDYLAPELIKKYNSIFDEAQRSVRDKNVFLERVKIARLPLKYAMLEQAKVIGIGESGIVLNDNGNYKVNPKIISLLDEFLAGCKTIGNVHVNEKQLDADLYVSRYKAMLSKTMKNPFGLFKPVKYLTEPNWKYQANGEKTLTDGFCGDEDYHFNWIGFEGNDMEVIIDLQKTVAIKKVSADFLQVSFSWVFFPEEFEVRLSNDGENFNNVSNVENTVPVTKEETASPFYSFIKNFSCDFNNTEARYIKVKAINRGICPKGHPGYPFKGWIFTDEIVIE